MKTTLLAAALALTFAAAPAFAGEGNGDPFPNNAGTLVTVMTNPPAQVVDAGAAAQTPRDYPATASVAPQHRG